MPVTVTFMDEQNPEAANKGWKVLRPVPGASYNFVQSGTSQASVAGPAGSRVVRIGTSDGGRYEIGTAPTATTSSPIIAASTYEYVRIDEGDKVAILNISGV